MQNFHNTLTNWYKHNKRELPWRNTKDSYKIWVSEIILQQTRVQQGWAYYIRFITQFPTIQSLAEASEEEVLKIWQGLGYYSRARNMHHTAKIILSQFDGTFPESYDRIISLKGIGEYTAAAISSIAFNLPYAVVDGNVYRVLSRIFGITTPIDTSRGKKEFYALAQEILNKEQPGITNQAIMELGAIQCLPINPLCENCPFNDRCFALVNKTTGLYPVKSKQVKVRDRFFNYLIIELNGAIYLEKRDQRDIWKNLYQFPLIETIHEIRLEELIEHPEWKEIFNSLPLEFDDTGSKKLHLLTHQRLHLQFFTIRIKSPVVYNGAILVPINQLAGYPVPKPIENHLMTMAD